jgi:sugar (pentulose or hexulose) kinase
MQAVGVIDIGKTNAKFAVVDLDTMSEIAVRTMPNRVRNDGPYPHFDIEAIWEFLKEAIAELNREHALTALSITTHGACAVLVDAEGGLALPVLDYEHDVPDTLAAGYDAVRPGYGASMSPRLPMGLNLGAQLYWQAKAFPEAFAAVKTILFYPQYWAYRLTGVMAGEMTSIGCHTDLWDFGRKDYSAQVDAMGWRERFAPIRAASDVLGATSDEVMAELGLPRPLPVHCGIHDSNASLLPHVLTRTPPFSVVSTGTWVIVASPGGELDGLDETRDCLANIDALGRAVPSARFMGGREYSTLTDGDDVAPDATTVADVIENARMLLPSVQRGSGPFPDRQCEWRNVPDQLDAGARYAIVSFYLALMTAECVALSGGHGEIVVEGPFARNGLYCQMLAAASGQTVLASRSGGTGTAIGAALLTDLGRAKLPEGRQTFLPEAEFQRYAGEWRSAIAS